MRKPKFVTLCGSTKFVNAYAKANVSETMAGNIVMLPGSMTHANGPTLTPEEKRAVDNLHLWKIDAADYIFVLNEGGYIGDSTSEEIAYAIYTHTPIRFLDGAAGEIWLDKEKHKLASILGRFMIDGPPHRPRNEESEDNGTESPLAFLLRMLGGQHVHLSDWDCGDPDCSPCTRRRNERKGRVS
jgi:hypothetical protein